MIQHFGPISGVACHKDWVATAGYDNQVILWNSHSKKSCAVGRHDHLANQADFSPCGQYLITSSSDYSARLWSVPEMRLIKVFTDHSDDCDIALFSPDGKRIATTSHDGMIFIYDISGNKLCSIKASESYVNGLSWDPSGNRIATAGEDGAIQVFSTTNG